MQLDYKTTTAHPDKLRTLHIIVIDGEALSTTREKEVLVFAKPRLNSKHDWRDLKEAVRLGNSLQIKGGI